MFLRNASLCSTMLFFACLIVLPQSYFPLKAFALGLYLVVHAVVIAAKQESYIYARDFFFYALLCAVAVTWSMVGIVRGTAVGGILASLKLYVGWSMVYFVIITLLRNSGRADVLHRTFALSVFGIAGLNLFAMLDAFLQLGFLGEEARKELGLSVEFRDGYVRFGGNNIASLFFLVGYLVAFKLSKPPAVRDRLGSLALALGLCVAILSGRRGLWLVVCAVPLLIFAIAALASTWNRISATGMRVLACYAVLGVAGTAGFMFLSATQEWEFVDYLKDAFSAEDERSIQKVYLIESFAEYPLFGSGFGGSAGYTRSDESPWLYELTYHQLLFNLGLLGSALLLIGLAYYFYLALGTLRRSGADFPLHFGMLSGFVVMLIGSYSNPYMQFFDSMVYIMFFVYLNGGSAAAVYIRRARRPEVTSAA